MKYCVTLLLLLAAAFNFPVHAQVLSNPYPLTCTYDSCFSYNAATRENSKSYEAVNYIYDDQHHLLKEVHYITAVTISGGQPVTTPLVDSIVYKYDSGFNYVSWKDKDLTLYENGSNSNGLLSWTKSSTVNRAVHFTSLQYDASGRKTGDNTYTDDEGTGHLRPDRKTYTYNQKGQIIREIDSSESSDMFIRYTMDSISYTADGQVAVKKYYMWRNNHWTLNQYDQHNYASGRLISDVSVSIDTNGHSTVHPIDSFAYNSAGKLLLAFRRWTSLKAYYQKDTFTYDTQGSLQSVTDYTYDGTTWSKESVSSYDHYSGGGLKDKDSLVGNAIITTYHQTVSYDSDGRALDDNTTGFDWAGTQHNYMHEKISTYAGGRLQSLETTDRTGSSYGTSTSNCYNYFFYGSYPFPKSGLRTSEGRTGITNLYPQPVTDKITLSLQLDDAAQLQISIYDLLGNRIYAADYAANATTNQLTIEVPPMSKGVYVLNIDTNKGSHWSRKFVKM